MVDRKGIKYFFDLSGVAIVKSSIEPYRDTWLFCLALLLDVELPQLDLPGDCAESAFALANYCTHREMHPQEMMAQPAHQPDTEDSDDEPLKFGWEEEEQSIPKELLEL